MKKVFAIAILALAATLGHAQTSHKVTLSWQHLRTRPQKTNR